MTRLLSGLYATLLVGECISVPEKRVGNLEVVATDITGQKLSSARIELFPGESRIAAVESSSAKTRVPYGGYRLRVHAPGFASQWQDIRISQPDTVVRVELQIGTECGIDTASIGGKIRFDASRGDVWVKVTPLRGTGGGEAHVSRTGAFTVAGLQTGTYVVLVLQGDLVAHHQIVRMRTDPTELNIEIRQPR